MTVGGLPRVPGAAGSVLLGFLLGGSGTLMLPLGDAISKHLAGEGYHVLQVAWGRWAAHLAMMTPLMLWFYGPRRMWPRGPGFQVVRSMMLVIASIFYIQALRLMPLADAAAVLFFAPLTVVVLSALVLKERVGLRRWLAVLAGFGGVLLIVRPGFSGAHDWGALFAGGATLSFAFYFLLTRKAAGRNPPMVTLWFMALVGTLAMAPFAAATWRPPAPQDWLLFAAMGGVMGIGHLLIIQALDFVEASAMAPLPYLELVTATVVGYLWFGDFPDILTWAGCAVVIGAGLFVAYRERAAAATPA
ncbi:MAG TPA: DMT family transporter [Alphaproteobacteria bacterium]|jgi:drug/metabolite transporter (DMT)-like permease|nr:DMT family transporter [Alphaproteobacteria bacterium]